MKKTLRTLLIIVMCLMVLSLKGKHAEAKEAASWASLQELIDQAKDGDTIVLDRDLRRHGERDRRIQRGAAIGSGSERDCCGTITINGGNLSLCLEGVVLGDSQKNCISIIGHGFRGEENGSLKLADGLKVHFEGKDPVARNERVSTCQSFSGQCLHIG